MRCLALRNSGLRVVLLLALVAAPASTLFCQQPDFDRLGRRLSKSLKKFRAKTVIVTEVVLAGAMLTPRDQALADRLSNALKVHAQGFEVLERSRYQEQLKDLRSRSNALSPAEWAEEVGKSVQADAVIVCTVQSEKNEAKLSVQAYEISTGKLIARERENLPRDPIPPVPTWAAQGSFVEAVYRAGQSGVTIPTCVQCPPPEYSPEARNKKYEATVTLETVISAEGQVTRIAVVKDPGMGLAQKAIEAVRTWSFKPALKDGKPVAVFVPIEVTFRFFK